MKASFEINDRTQASLAIMQTYSIWELYQEEDLDPKVAELLKRNGFVNLAKSGDDVRSEPDPAPAPVVVEEPKAAPKEPEGTRGRGRPPGTKNKVPTNGHDEDPEVARERLKEVAKANGIAWLRPLLETQGVAKFSDLTNAQVRSILDGLA